MNHELYTIKKRVTVIVTLTKEYRWIDYSYSYRGTDKYIYTFKDENDKTLVWKTSTVIGMDDDNAPYGWVPVRVGDKIKITATVKEFSEYKGAPQVVIARVKVNDIIERALTKEEKITIKREEQIASLSDDDFLWEITYSRYKKHYADCETLAGSYKDKDSNGAQLRCPTIVVIIRAGRLKPSGTRGLHYSGYEFEDENGNRTCYRAICEENAEKRVRKDFPNRTWKCCNVYKY